MGTITRKGQITLIDTQRIGQIRTWYLATSESSGVTTSTPGWTTSFQTIDSINIYLWMYQETLNSSNAVISYTEPTIIGHYGHNGAQGPQGIQGIQGIQGVQGVQGDPGISVTEIRTYYYLSDESPDSSIVGSLTVPEYTVTAYLNDYSYYIREESAFSDNTTSSSDWIINLGLTAANKNAFEAADAADAAAASASASATSAEAAQAATKWFIHNSTGSIVAAGNDLEFDKYNINTYGYNAITASGYIALRNNNTELATFKTDSLTFYRPGSPSIKMLELTAGNGLKMYNPTQLNQELMTLNNNVLSFKDLQGKILASFGNDGVIQSGNYIRGSDTRFASSGTKISLINGEIYTPYFRLSQGMDNLNAGAYIRGDINAVTGTIGEESTGNYWSIGTLTDYDNRTTAKIIGNQQSFLQLGNEGYWRLTNNRIHTGWHNRESSLLSFLNFNDSEGNNKHWDYGLHAPQNKDDKFLYIRNANSNTSLSNLYYDIDDTSAVSYWDYQFYVDGSGNLYAQNLYAKIDGNWVLIGGANGTYLPLSGGIITGNLTVDGILTATASSAKKVEKNLTIKWGAANTEGTDKFTYNGSTAKTITLGNAATKDVISSLTNNTSSTDLPTAKAVADYVGDIVNSGITNAGTGLSKNGNTINHSNSITAQTTQAVYPIKIDAQGHISAYGNAITSMPASDVSSWAKAATKPTYNYSEISGTPTALKNPNALQIKIYDGNSNPSTTVSYDGSAANKIANVASNNAIVGLNTTIAEGGVSTFNITKADGSTDSFEVTIVASAASSAETADSLTVGTVGSTSRPVYFSNGIPKQIGYTIQSNVPSGAVFTDTTYSAGTGLSLTGTTFNISTVPIANGGTGQTTARNGFHALTGGLTEGTADVTDNTVLMTGNTNAATNDWYYRKASHLYNYIKGKTDTAYLKLTGGTVTGATQINNILTLYREGTTANNYPAGIQFSVKDTTNNLVDNNAYIYVYDDHATSAYGTNMVIRSGGGMFIGGGESPSAHYSAKGSTYAGEDTFVTTDGTLYLQSNGNTIANRLGMAMNTAHQLIPIKADTYTNNVGSIGSGSYYWQHIYGTNYHGTVYNISEKVAMHYDSNLDAIVFSFA